MEAFLRRPILRIIPVGLILIAIQKNIFSTIVVFDVRLQIVLAFCAASGIRGGAERGAFLGFVVGLMYDLGTAAPLGQHALSYGLAGFTAGLVNLVAVDPHWWLSMIFVTIGGAVGEASGPVVQVFVSDGGWQGQRLNRIVPIVAIGCGLMSPIFIPLSRWCLAIKTKTWKVPTE